ncbi:hypothetical protein DPMN_184675 [Dreissena polymorpha]|uniref:Uncharacterized protein n=1 Tax=Dreissena polymorpha TaxID=45954 RepID=A0A9D4DLC1_DREPO|nr:hypothetical protein DPMN_184675 [Dreissena polymorpha]
MSADIEPNPGPAGGIPQYPCVNSLEFKSPQATSTPVSSNDRKPSKSRNVSQKISVLNINYDRTHSQVNQEKPDVKTKCNLCWAKVTIPGGDKESLDELWSSLKLIPKNSII